MSDNIPSPAPLVAAGSWNALLSVRPRLLGPIDFLRGRAKERPDLYAIVKTQDTLLSSGVAHLVEQLPPDKTQPFIDEALANVARGVTNIHQDSWIWLEHAILAYDLFHDRIDAGDRARMIEWMNAHIDVFKDDENPFHNSIFAKMRTYLRIAFGTWRENPQAAAFRDYALIHLWRDRVVPVLKMFGAGGGFTECGWYCRHCIWHLVEALEIARRFDGYDGFQDAASFFYNRMAYNLLEPYPGHWLDGMERYACEGDGHNGYSQAMEFPRLTRGLLAAYFRGSELAGYVSGRRGKGNERWAVYDFLYGQQFDEPKDIRDMPTAHLSAGIGKVHARGDWSDDASWLRFECGHFFNQHQHQEAGNFEIFRREPLATESGEYVDWSSAHSVNWLVRTIAHNCILVHKPGEFFRNIRNRFRLRPGNDGGQGTNVYVVPTLNEWLATRADHDRGRIVAYENQRRFLYVVGDCTAGYSRGKVELCRRHIVFIRPHLFVILDRVRSTKREYAKTWLLHCMNEPELDGRTAKITNGPASLFVRTLLPVQATTAKIYGYTYDGRTYEPSSDRLSKTAEKWRIEVRPTLPAKKDVFLHVLSTDGEVPAEVVRDGESVGARGDGWQVLLDPAGRGTLKIGGESFALEPEVRRGKFED